MKTMMVGVALALAGVFIYLGIVAWIFLGGHEHEPLTGEQGTLWTLAVMTPLCLGVGIMWGTCARSP